MKKKIFFSIAIIAVLGISLLLSKAEMRTVHAAAGEVEINETNFPDQIFREYVEQFDTDGNGALSAVELNKVSNIDVRSSGITDLAGIEYFSSVIYLYCQDNSITSLDISSNTKLSALYCYNNNLTSLDLSNNTALVVLSCHTNNFTNLDLSHNTELVDFYCGDTNLSSLNLSSNTKLEQLGCQDNNLSSLDVSKNVNLTSLYCYNNNLRSLDVSKNVRLKNLDCQNNNLTSLNLGSITNLTSLYCYSNSLISLDVSKNINLKTLRCEKNKLESLNVSNNINLKQLDCYTNNITSLDVSNNINLQRLWCYNNPISSLDVSSNTSLTDFSCGGSITAPLYKDGDNYYIDLTEFSLDKGKVNYTNKGTYNSGTGRIEFQEALTVGSVVRYKYLTGLDDSDTMNVDVEISRVIDLNVPELTQPIVGTPNNTAAGVNVTWTKTADATGYYIFRRVSGGGWSWIGTAEGENTLSYTDTKAVGGTVYAYTVRAYYKDSAGKYYYSTYNTTGKGVIRLTEPTVNTPTNAASGINVTWTKTAGATGYYIFRRASGESFSWIGTATGTSTLSYVDTTAKAGTVYAYTVRAYYKNSAGTIYYSSYDTTGKGGIRLIAPAMKLSAATGKVTVSWTKTTGALGYYIYRKTETGSWMLVATIKSGNTLSYADTTAKAGTKYYYAMKAYYGGYTSVWSNIPGVTAK